jgi:GPH family glycoside/pentoside/hexuronide:cation symporter
MNAASPSSAAMASVQAGTRLTAAQGWRYGLMGLPLAFVALPLYVVLPNYYASTFGVPLASLGAVLLMARLADAFMDPLLGRWSDRLFRRGAPLLLARVTIASVALGVGFCLLFFPAVESTDALLIWALIALLITYAAYSFISISHQSWGAMLGDNEAYRSQVVAWREGLSLCGVVLASVMPSAMGLPATTAVFFFALAIGLGAWQRAPSPLGSNLAATESLAEAEQPPTPLWLPLRRSAFRSLLAVFVLNGIASAIPATLILFFVQDRLQAPPAQEPLFLGSYFVFAALAMPVWLRCIRRVGLARSWLVGMVLSVATFIFAATLGAGDASAFVVVCALSGVALGADLTVPGALLAGTIAVHGDSGRAEGAYFGWWNFATKLNLALAAGLALPLLGGLGYSPGARAPEALLVLTAAYCLLPCILKLIAAWLLYALILRRSP